MSSGQSMAHKRHPHVLCSFDPAPPKAVAALVGKIARDTNTARIYNAPGGFRVTKYAKPVEQGALSPRTPPLSVPDMPCNSPRLVGYAVSPLCLR